MISEGVRLLVEKYISSEELDSMCEAAEIDVNRNRKHLGEEGPEMRCIFRKKTCDRELLAKH